MLLLRSILMLTFTTALFFAGCGDSEDEKPQPGSGGAGGSSAAGPRAEVRKVCLEGCTKLAACYAEQNPDAPPGQVDCQTICTEATEPSSGPPCPNATSILAEARACLAKRCDELEACLEAVPECD